MTQEGNYQRTGFQDPIIFLCQNQAHHRDPHDSTMVRNSEVGVSVLMAVGN